MMRKQERKESYEILYRMLRKKNMTDEDINEVRRKFAIHVGADVGLFFIEIEQA